MRRQIGSFILGLGVGVVASGSAGAQQPRQDYVPPPQIFGPQQERAPQAFPEQRLRDLQQQHELEQRQFIFPPVREVPRRGR